MKMYTISKESASKIRETMKGIKKATVYKRLQAVALRGEGKKNGEVAEITGFHSDYVGQLCKLYCKEGLEGLISDGRKGGNNRNMSDVEAEEFLERFEERAKNGQIITIEEIAKAYDESVGKEHSSLSTIYYFMHNHNWRIVTPRRQHPGKASDEDIESSKKLTLR